MSPHPDETIVALSSAPGPGERAIVRLSGPETRAVVERVFSCEAFPKPGRVNIGSLRLTGVHSPLPAELYFFRGPKSYTGQDLAELHCVSSPPLVERLIADLLAAGARPAQPGEFTLRAFLAGKKDLPQAESVLALIESQSDSDLQKALAQLAGGISQPTLRVREDLLNLLADVEAALDFVDEDIEFVTNRETILRLANALAHLTNLQRQLDDRGVSRTRVRAVLVGEPNAGKSSLFNALLGRPAALVSPIAGTTRDYLAETLKLDGIEIELVDTAGLRPTDDAIEAEAQRLGREASATAELKLWCVPAGEELPREFRANRSTILVRTKADLAVSISDGIAVSIHSADSLKAFQKELASRALELVRPPLAPSQARCRGHIAQAIEHLRRGHAHAIQDDPPELLALALRTALDQIGEMVGAIHTDDLLDRIFSRFCIGK